jgi:hypothetical protein
VQSVPDALAAEAGGADRLEVVRDIERGGLITKVVAALRLLKSPGRGPRSPCCQHFLELRPPAWGRHASSYPLELWHTY